MNAPISPFTGIEGWLTNSESAFLVNLAREHAASRESVIVNVGCEYGRSVSEFASVTHGTIYAVDQWPTNHHAVGDLAATFKKNCAAWASQITIMRGLSWECGKDYDGPAADIILIDAGHARDEVAKDIAAWWPHLKAGGYMVFHDYWKNEQSHPLHLEVKQAVDAFAQDAGLEVVSGPDSVAYIIRPAADMEEDVVSDGDVLEVAEMTTEEVMEYLGYSRYKLNNSGLTPVRNEGRALFYDRAEVEALKESLDG